VRAPGAIFDSGSNVAMTENARVGMVAEPTSSRSEYSTATALTRNPTGSDSAITVALTMVGAGRCASAECGVATSPATQAKAVAADRVKFFVMETDGRRHWQPTQALHVYAHALHVHARPAS
jgi:hypothetical protein